MKEQKGVTLLILVITIVVMLILTFTLTINMESYQEQATRTNFENDMESLKQEIDQYYARTKDLPVLQAYTNITMLENIRNKNDNNEYYVIDLKKLDVKLNYGKDYDTIASKKETEDITNLLDIYIINKQSHTIYYPKGVTYGGMTHYRLPEVYTQL